VERSGEATSSGGDSHAPFALKQPLADAGRADVLMTDAARTDVAPSPIVRQGNGEAGLATRASFRYHASLDGLRALAVLAIIAFHYDYGWARGAFLGVDLFFVISGFLITSLLIAEWRRADRIAVGSFWGRRARRLIPALLVTLLLVAVFTRHELDPWKRTGVRNDGLASLFYVANWRFIADNQGYFGLFAAPSPLRHIWSLAIEEQFYLVWPLVVLFAMRVGRGSLRVLTGICIAGVAASVAVMAALHDRNEQLRAYYGTDARMHTILVGALLAIVLAAWRPSAVAARRLAASGVVGFVVMLYAWHTATGTSGRYYQGGSLGFALLGALVITAALQPGALRRVLALRPLAWIGRLSYGLYIFHWPLTVWLVPSRVHISGLQLTGLRVGSTFALATVSYYLVELPIRQRRMPALPRSFAARGRRTFRDPARWMAVPATCLTAVLVVASASGATPPPSYLVGERPKIANYIWGYGDPLFCGTPRANETREAEATARRLGAPGARDSGSRLRVLLLGDSTACSLFPGLVAAGHQVGADVAQASVFGCGVASGQITTTRHEQITLHSERCPEMVDPDVRHGIEKLKPNVVLWMSIWEKSDLLRNGKVLVSGTKAGDHEILRRMDSALTRVTAGGAKVVMVTEAAPAPNDAQGTNNTSNKIDDAGYARLNNIQRRFAAQHRDKVVLVDLASRVCPGGPPCPAEVDGIRLRPDGRHFTPEAAAIEAHWLLPKLVRAASS